MIKCEGQVEEITKKDVIISIKNKETCDLLEKISPKRVNVKIKVFS